MTEDVVSFYGDVKHDCEWLTSNYIQFVFFYDPQKDEISHVRLQNKLILNDELIQMGETKDCLLSVDGEDYGEPFVVFEELLKKSGINP